jgi:hypothetical protein
MSDDIKRYDCWKTESGTTFDVANPDGKFVRYDDHKAAVESLERRIAELEKDAARYRFLRNSKHEITLIADTEESGQLLYQEFPSGPLLDERIDTAAGKEQA